MLSVGIHEQRMTDDDNRLYLFFQTFIVGCL